MQSTHIIESLINAPAGSELDDALKQRAEILRLSQASHDAVIAPKEPGGISYQERAALAKRMALLNGHEALADHYQSCLDSSGGNGSMQTLSDPTAQLDADQRLTAIVRYTDLVTKHPREATRADIESLKEAGISEPDIVRVTELIAFVNYQLRVVAGIELLRSL